jgi:hypothetical protein
MRYPCRLAFVCVAFALFGCSGGGAVPPPASSLGSGGARSSSADVMITIPHPTATAARPAYVSPSTQSLKISVLQGATHILDQIADLTPTSTGCTSTLASTECKLTLALDPGTYSADVTTYDQTNAGGNVLSHGHNVGFTVVSGASNEVFLSLSGVPVRYLIAADGGTAAGNATTGFTLPGMGAQPFLVEALDADSNFIVGPGAPTFGVDVRTGSGWSATDPTAAQPNVFAVTPSGRGNAATLDVTASFSDDACSQPTAVCTASFTAVNHMQTLFVANCGSDGCGYGGDSIQVYAVPYTGAPTATITNGIDGPWVMALDAQQDLLVGNNGNMTITAYAPPYTGAPLYTLGTTFLNPFLGLAVDSQGELLESDAGGVTVFGPPISAQNVTTVVGSSESPMYPASLAGGNLFVGASYGVDVFAPPGYTYPQLARVQFGAAPACFKAGPDGTVYAILPSLNETQLSHPPYTSTVALSGNLAYDVTFDASGHAFVAEYGNVISAWSATGANLATISNGVGYFFNTVTNCQRIATDAGDDLFSANSAEASVTIYAPPYTGTPTTVVSGLNIPEAALLGP